MIKSILNKVLSTYHKINDTPDKFVWMSDDFDKVITDCYSKSVARKKVFKQGYIVYVGCLPEGVIGEDVR